MRIALTMLQIIKLDRVYEMIVFRHGMTSRAGLTYLREGKVIGFMSRNTFRIMAKGWSPEHKDLLLFGRPRL